VTGGEEKRRRAPPTPVPLGVETPQQVFGEDLYHIYYRFLETDDEYFDYAPARLPPQGTGGFTVSLFPTRFCARFITRTPNVCLG
jgi:hypothetical protein